MNKYLVSATEVYRVDNEESAAALIDEAKAETKYILAKYSSVKKEKRLRVKLSMNGIKSLLLKIQWWKDPISNIDVNYEVSF